MSNSELIDWLKKKAETVTMPGSRKMYEAAAKALAEPELSTNLAEVGTDCISREAVLNEFCHSCDGWSCNPNTCCKTEWIRKLPPIQPKKGRWIGKYPVSSICSECGYLINDSKVKVFAFCPNCGADMRGEQDG